MKNAYINGSIFVQIAAYRDKELLPTLRDLLSKADKPKLLHICICWQHSEDDSWDNLDEYINDDRFTIIDINYKDSKGACWARHLIQQQYTKEKFTFQLDSHHRFVESWDTKLKNMYAGLQLNGSPKPLITSYLPAYDIETSKPINLDPWMLSYNYFANDGPLHTIPEAIPNWNGLGGPVKGRFYSAHFAFTDGKFSETVQHDPEMYFHGEEISIAVRAFTHGYDIYHPHQLIAWHHYGRKSATKHWDDSKTWEQYNHKSYKRVRKLFGINNEKFKPKENKYGFGKVRSLYEYERYAGVRFRDQKIQQFTLDRSHPPNPEYTNKLEYDNSFIKQFKHCIDLAYDQVPHDDYIFWAVSFFNDKDEEVYRQDADPEEIERLKSDIDGYCKLWRWFATDEKITKWRVWPQSKENGFADPIEGNI